MNSVLKFLIKLQADGNNMMSVARQVTGQLRQVESSARSVGASIKQAFSPSNLGSSLMAIPGMQFLMNPYTLLASGVGAVTKLGAEAQTTANVFSTLVGDETKAKAILGEIGDYASKSPFSKLDLTANAQQMVSFGISTDKAMGYLKQLGDISGGNKEKLSSLSLVMGQVTAGGKLMGQDLLQFINAGFNPIQELVSMTGKSYKELKELMEKGAVTSEHVAMAIAHATSEGGKFYNVINNMADNVEVKWNQVLGNLQEMAINLFTQIEPYVSQFISLFSKAIPYIYSALSGLFSVLGAVVGFIVEWRAELLLLAGIIGSLVVAANLWSIALGAYTIATSIATSATSAWTTVQWLLNAALVNNPIGVVITIIGALIAVVVYCWNKFAGFRAFLITAWDTLKQFGNIIKDFVINRFVDLLDGLGKVGKAVKQLISGDFEGAWNTAGEAVDKLSGAHAVRTAIQQTKGVAEGVKGKWQENLAREEAKDKKGDKKASIGTPSLKGSAPVGEIEFDVPADGKKGKGKKGKGAKTADAIATGGSKPTTINISISKLIETLAVQMMDKADASEIERVVLQAMNRALAIASSTE